MFKSKVLGKFISEHIRSLDNSVFCVSRNEVSLCPLLLNPHIPEATNTVSCLGLLQALQNIKTNSKSPHVESPHTFWNSAFPICSYPKKTLCFKRAPIILLDLPWSSPCLKVNWLVILTTPAKYLLIQLKKKKNHRIMMRKEARFRVSRIKVGNHGESF